MNIKFQKQIKANPIYRKAYEILEKHGFTQVDIFGQYGNYSDWRGPNNVLAILKIYLFVYHDNTYEIMGCEIYISTPGNAWSKTETALVAAIEAAKKK